MSEQPTTDRQGPPMIEAIGLCKYYGDFAAVEDISFTVPQGQVVAFLGPNGAGKSTTMKLLTGYSAPSKGVARIAGHDMAVDRQAGSCRLGYLPENGPLYPDFLCALFDDHQHDVTDTNYSREQGAKSHDPGQSLDAKEKHGIFYKFGLKIE